MDETEQQLLGIYDTATTVFVVALLILTIPLATGAYSRMLWAKQFRSNYSIRMIVLNGSAELLNCLLYTIVNQLTTFPFASPFYAFLLRHELAAIFCSFWAFVSVLSIHTSFYVAISRLSALYPSLFMKMNSPLIFILCAITTAVGAVPAILEMNLSSFTYAVIDMGDTSIYMPSTNGEVGVLTRINYGHTVVTSALSLLANLLLCLTLFRNSRGMAAISTSRKSRQERGLMITSIVSYLFYMVYFVNTYFAREFHWAWCAYSQYLFLGFACASPFWCLMIFSGSVRATVLKRKTTMETRTAVQSITVQHR